MIIPIEGSLLYNGEQQATFVDVETEMIIKMQLSLLGYIQQGNNRKHPDYIPVAT
jgi:hypothetical protein